MTEQLSQKEKSLLKDQLKHEEICIKKYSNYASRTKDPELKNMFNQFASEEQRHYNTINSFLGNAQGQYQTQSTVQDQQSQAQAPQMTWETGTMGESGTKGGTVGLEGHDDASMLNDMLMTEKYVSSTYDTAVFESANPSLRQSLQQIQKDEQKHGEGIFRYMQRHGMYNVQ